MSWFLFRCLIIPAKIPVKLSDIVGLKAASRHSVFVYFILLSYLLMSDVLYRDVMLVGGAFLSLMDQALYSAVIWTQLPHADSF